MSTLAHRAAPSDVGTNRQHHRRRNIPSLCGTADERRPRKDPFFPLFFSRLSRLHDAGHFTHGTSSRVNSFRVSTSDAPHSHLGKAPLSLPFHLRRQQDTHGLLGQETASRALTSKPVWRDDNSSRMVEAPPASSYETRAICPSPSTPQLKVASPHFKQSSPRTNEAVWRRRYGSGKGPFKNTLPLRVPPAETK